MALEGEIHALQPPVGFKTESVSVFLSPREGVLGGSQAERSPGGKFTMQDVAPGRYLVHAQMGGEDGYVKSVSYNGHELTGHELELTSSDAGGKLEVTVAFDTGEVEGVVQDASGAPKPDATVAIFQDAQDNCLCSKSAIADRKGHFHVKGVAPGEYVAVAYNSDDENFGVAGFTDDMKKSAAKVTVSAGVKQTLTVQMTK